MTRVCLVGADDVNLRYELLSRETAREALATYDLEEPFENTVAVETVSLGAAVALCNDLDWYLVRFADAAFVKEPSISETEWLSRDLATAIRDDDIAPGETGRYLRVYGIDRPDAGGSGGEDNGHDEESNGDDEESAGHDEESDGHDEESDGHDRSERDPGQTERPPKLVEPMLVARTGETLPEYDLRDVEDTLRVRVTESEFEA